METIQVSKDIKKQFERDRFMFKEKEDRLVTQNEFLGILIKSWRKLK